MDLPGESIREALAALPAGAVIVSSRDTTGFRGMTATSFTSASLEPPLVLVCLDGLAATRDAVVSAAAFNVSVLERAQEFLAERFAGRAPQVDAAWREIPHRLGANGLPIVGGSVAWFECALSALHPAGDHDIAVGRVTAAGRAPGEPLVHWDRAYWKLS